MERRLPTQAPFIERAHRPEGDETVSQYRLASDPMVVKIRRDMIGAWRE
jgi:hypothetical protein